MFAKSVMVRAVNATPLIRSAEMQRIEHREGATIEDVLAGMYVDEGMTQDEIAERLGVSRPTVVRWMAAAGIPTRDRRALSAASAASVA